MNQEQSQNPGLLNFFCFKHVIKPYIAITIILSLLAGISCLAQDQASFERSRIFREFSTDDLNYDVVTYNFDGISQTPYEVMNAGLKAIRKEGLKNSKEMTLLIFCDLKTTDRSYKAVYPYGIYFKTAAIKDPQVPIQDLTNTAIVTSPMHWDKRINEWIYLTNNVSKSGPEILENANYTMSTNTLDRGWFMSLDDLTNKAAVYAKFGKPRYFVWEHGTYSEIYPVDDTDRAQVGTVRIWYEADKVTKTGSYMDNK